MGEKRQVKAAQHELKMKAEFSEELKKTSVVYE